MIFYFFGSTQDITDKIEADLAAVQGRAGGGSGAPKMAYGGAQAPPRTDLPPPKPPPAPLVGADGPYPVTVGTEL